MSHNDLISCEYNFILVIYFLIVVFSYDITFYDMLTRVRNAILARAKRVYIIESSLIKSIFLVLKEQEYIDSFKEGFIFDGVRYICVDLKYHPFTNVPYISSLRRISRPGLRRYTSASKIPKICGGLGGFIF